jgi:Putative peptidoglycan binding domain
MIISPRFFGDDVLESCLTGHRMFAGSGDPPESVALVQQALADLGFSVSVDGIFGPETGSAVTAYKTQKGLTPNDPVVGPGTMAALDADFAHELFDAKAAQLADTRFDLGLRTGTRVDVTDAFAVCEFQNGVCVEVGHLVAYAMPTTFLIAWSEAGGVDGSFGLPTSDPMELDELRSAQEFTFVTLIVLEAAPIAVGFYPRIDRASVHLPAARALAATGGDGTVAIGYHKRYLAAGLDADDPMNPAEVFAEPYGDLFSTDPSPLKISFSGDKSAGVAAPNMEISGLSRRLGTVSGDIAAFVPTSAATAPQFDVSKYFPDSATLLGGIKLKDLTSLFEVPPLTDPTSEGVPQLKVDTTQAPQVRTFLKWNPKVNANTLNIGDVLQFGFDGASAGQEAGSFSLESQTVTGLPPTQPSAYTAGRLTNFNLAFAPGGSALVTVSFSEFSFLAEKGRKPDVRIKLASDAIKLGGQLDFLQILMKKLQDIFGTGPSVKIEDGTITAGYSVAVPTISIGVFSLENIRVGASVIIPLSGTDPTAFRFAFAEEDHPFTLTVELLGGGGFFALAVDSTGIEAIELAVAAGANVCFDLAGLASGNAHVMVGIFFHYDAATDTSITGYLRAGAELTVLQLVSLHVEFYAGLTYIEDQHVIYASVSVMVDVAVGLLHTGVTLSLERKFAVPGPSGPMPMLAEAIAGRVGISDVMAPEDWAQYAQAFA